MHKRKIGTTDLKALPFVLGGNVFGWTADEKSSFAILDEYTDRGFQMIDTADIYSAWAEGNSGGESERIIGKWLNKRKNRDKIILATKVGGDINPTLGNKRLKKERILASIEASLHRLQTDYIDIYYTHYDDKTVPIEEVLETYSQLIQSGKVRYIGASNISAHRIEESMTVAKKNNLPPYSILQPEYNLYNRMTYEKEYKPLAIKYGFAVFTYYSLASGFLSGKYNSTSQLTENKRKDQLKNYFNDRGLKILRTLHTISEKKEITPSQLALSWLLHQPTITAPISSVSKVDQLDILKAVEINLSDEELRALE